MKPIAIRELTKRFGRVTAVDDVDLDIQPGELFFLLGPSGCGKTTLLRMLAGFSDPSSGSIRFGEDDVTHLPANKRNCGMVFQGYALWPHMNVRKNVGFGLTVPSRQTTAAEREQRVDEVLGIVQMQPYADRKPNELSGGQQQRVALARALVIQPSVLLLDEPLSNLDAKLRLEMRSQIRHICKSVGTTGVYVTHDQKEALAMADRMAVMRDGHIVQVGEPRELYERPVNRFVADFLGQTNFFTAEVIAREGDAVVLKSPLGGLICTAYRDPAPTDGQVTCSVRPESIRIERSALQTANARPNHFKAMRTETVYLGEMAQHELSLPRGLKMRAFELNPRASLGEEDMIHISIDPNDVVLLED